MSNLLHITASIQDQSVTRELSHELVNQLQQAANNELNVVERDLSANNLPLLKQDLFAANLTAAAERTPAQQELSAIADELIAELQQADTLVLSLPMYNFAVPATFKAWIDLVARAGTTFRYTENGPEGLLQGKKAYLVVATGGTPIGSDYDLHTPWVKLILGFMGITDVQIIAAEGGIKGSAEEMISKALS